MYAKLIVAVVVLACAAGQLLVLRQQRLERGTEMAALQRRLLERRRELWTLRCRLARRCAPPQAHRHIAALGDDWTPLLTEARRPPGQEASAALDAPDGP